jgi:uncharacterized SAM-binding protein YcdF (DUF218 family)
MYVLPMFFILSKLLYYLVMPVTWIIALLMYALVTRIHIRRKGAVVAALVLLLVFTNQVLVNEALKIWERPAVPLAAMEKPYDVAVVLTGVTNSAKQPADRVYFAYGADRVMHTVLLYKKGLVKHILISGGGATTAGQELNESHDLRQVFLLAGVPDSALTIENRSLNTRENALFSKEVLEAQFPQGRYLLVTSAFHMRRAEACFLKAGLPIDTFPTAFLSSDVPYTPERFIAPSEYAFHGWGVIAHEMLGYVVYKLMGYL